MSDSRLTAVLMLQEILEKHQFVSDVKTRFDKCLEADSAFINMLLLTALRRLVGLRRILKLFVKKKLPPQSKLAEYALLLGAAEILYLRTPDYAVINSYVDLIKKRLDKYVAGFVNAVLRKICAESEKLRAEDNNEFFPPEFRRLLKSSYGPKTIAAIERAALREPSLDLTAAAEPEKLAAKTGGTLLPLGTVRLPNNGNIAKIPGYAEGRWWVQDFSAALPVSLLCKLRPLAGLRVLDLCAAPGGKTAQLLAAGAQVTAIDVSAPRLKTLRANLKRLNLAENCEIICADALDWLHSFTAKPYDIVLLDAPCSATGTLRRHPELVHIKNLDDVGRAAELQSRFLTESGKALVPNGTLVYCTCALSRDEGENQISSFLDQNSSWRLLPLTPLLPPELSGLAAPQGWIRMLPSSLPQFGGADGFFIAFLNKEAA